MGAWVAVDKNGAECICSTKPYRDWTDYMWCVGNIFNSCAIDLPKGSIKKLIGRNLTWEDESVELEQDSYRNLIRKFKVVNEI